MLNQLIQIPSRYVDLTVDGCLIDGLAVMFGVGQRQHFYSDGNYLLPLGSDGLPPITGNRTGLTKRWHRTWYRHSFFHCLQLQQG
ncbi:MAG: hypothetical protein AAGE59_12975 [Cyanobacteria bacterium P01_F01_bin.86]